MDHMIQLRDALRLSQIRQPVTFPIRAGLSTSRESQRSIIWLLQQVLLPFLRNSFQITKLNYQLFAFILKSAMQGVSVRM